MKVDHDLLRDTYIADLAARMSAVMEMRLKSGAELISSQILHNSQFVVGIMFWRYPNV